MYNPIAQACVERSRIWSNGSSARMLLHLTKNLDVGISEINGKEVLRMTSNPNDIFALHCNHDDVVSPEQQRAMEIRDINEFRKYTRLLRQRILRT